MKFQQKLILLPILIAVFSFGCNSIEQSDKKKMPAPTEIITENTSNGHKEKDRLEWIEQMHKIEPNKSWRQQDLQSKLYRQTQRLSNTKSNTFGQWSERGSSNQSGRIHLTEYDATTNNIYVASSGGNIWKSDLSGSNWHCINDLFQIPNINMLRIIPHNGNKRMLVASDVFGAEGFFYSDNDGQIWSVATGLENIASWGYIRRAVVANDANRTIYLLALESSLGLQASIYKSTNHGASFSKIKYFSISNYEDVNNFDIWTDYYSDCLLFILENQNIYTIDPSNNSALIGSLPSNPVGSRLLTGAKTASNIILYALVTDNGQSQIYRSVNSGSNWTTGGSISQSPFMINSFTCFHSSPNRVFFGGTECYTSDNSGDTWQIVNAWGEYYGDPANKLHADIPGINIFNINGNEVGFIGTDGGVYISNDNIQTVNNISLNKLQVSQYYSTYTCRTDNSFVHAASQDQGYQKSTGGNSTGILNFEQILSGDYGHIVSSNQGQTIWMVYPGFAICYPDINNSNNWINWDFNGNISGNMWMPPLMDDPQNPNNVYLAGGSSSSSGAHIFKLLCNGSAISSSEGTFDFSNGTGADISAMAYSPINTNFRYVLNSDGIFYASTNGGTIWTKTNSFTGPAPHYFYGSYILASKIQQGKVFIAGSGYSNPPVYMSLNNGNTFTSISSGLPSTLVYSLAANADESRIYAATELGPYVYVVSENLWYDLYDGVAPDQVYWSVDFIDGIKTARFSTYGRGIWDLKEDNTDEIAAFTNANISIYPNPVKDNLTVRGITKSAIASIYSVNGKLLQTHQLSSSTNEINVNNLSKGVYIIKLQTDKESTVKQFIKQ